MGVPYGTLATEAGEVIQLGSGKAYSVGEVFELACRVLGVEAETEVSPERLRPERSEVQVLLSDPTRARDRLGWKAQTPLEVGLERTVAWLGQWLSRYDSDVYSV